MIPVSFSYSGDVGAAKMWRWFGNLRMGILERGMSFQNLNRGNDRISPIPGVEVSCRKDFNCRYIHIHIAPGLYAGQAEAKKAVVKVMLEWLINARGSHVAIDYYYDSVVVDPVGMAVFARDYAIPEYTFSRDNAGLIGRTGVMNFTQIRRQATEAVASLCHYQDAVTSGTESTLFLVVEVIGEDGIPSMRVEAEMMGTTKVCGALSEDLQTLHYVHSYLPPGPGLQDTHDTIVTRRVYQVQTNPFSGVKTWALTSSETIDYRAADLYWNDTVIDSEGGLGTFVSISGSYTVADYYTSHPPDGFFSYPQWPGTTVYDRKDGIARDRTYFKRSLAGSYVASEKSNSVTVVPNGAEYTPVTTGAASEIIPEVNFLVSNHCVGTISAVCDNLTTFSSGSTDVYYEARSGGYVTWHFGDGEAMAFTGTLNIDRGESSASNVCDIGGWSQNEHTRLESKVGSITVTNLDKACIYSTSNYQFSWIDRSSSLSSETASLPFPSGSLATAWYQSPRTTHDVYDATVEVDGVDIVHPIEVTNVSNIRNAFISFDQETELFLCGVNYQASTETTHSWKIFVKIPGDADMTDITSQVSEAYWGLLRTDLNDGVVLPRTDEQRIGDFNLNFEAMYFKRCTKEIEEIK